MKRLALLMGVTVLGGCASAPHHVPPPAPPAISATPAQQSHDARVTQVETMASEIPDWYANPPNDEHSLYAASTADSSDLGFALDKAILSAKRALADRLGGSVSSQHKEDLQEAGGNTQAVYVSDRSTTNQITDVVLSGYTVVQTKIVPTDTRYRAFVLLQYPLGKARPGNEADPVSVQNAKLKAAKAVEDLQKDIDAAKTHDSSAAKTSDDPGKGEMPQQLPP